jgi:hypothetical protein
MPLSLETTGQKDFGPCDCCGRNSRTVWGFVYNGPGAIASYFVHWTLGRVAEHGAYFDLILGRWGDGSSPDDRVAVVLGLRHTESGPSFMVLDASHRFGSPTPLAANILSRDDVLGSRWEPMAYDVVDTIWVQDPRVSEVVKG